MQNLSTPELLARIDALLTQAIGLGIAVDRMRADALYARDVLLVCDALEDTEGPALAQRFRALRSLQEAARQEAAHPEAKHPEAADLRAAAPKAAAADAARQDPAIPRRPGQRAERRRDAHRDRRRARGPARAPHGKERRRGPRRSADSDTAPLAAAEHAPRRRWFGRRTA